MQALGEQGVTGRGLLGLAALACEEQNFSHASLLLDKARAVGGDEDFWYKLTLTSIAAVVGQRPEDVHTKVWTRPLWWGSCR